MAVLKKLCAFYILRYQVLTSIFKTFLQSNVSAQSIQIQFYIFFIIKLNNKQTIYNIRSLSIQAKDNKTTDISRYKPSSPRLLKHSSIPRFLCMLLFVSGVRITISLSHKTLHRAFLEPSSVFSLTCSIHLHRCTGLVDSLISCQFSRNRWFAAIARKAGEYCPVAG